jgi:hypothetical protein
VERRKPLKRAPLKQGKPLERKTPLTAKKGMERGGELLRSTPLRAKPKPKRTDAEAALSEAWWSTVAKGKRCVRCGTRWRVQGHHVLAQQFLRRLAKSLGVPASTLLWDVRIGMPLCETCHARHTNRIDPIPLALVPASAFEFAIEYECRPRLEREYAG